MRIGNREFDTENNCYIMGILNITPDSFSDGGNFNSLDTALKHVEQMVQDGADIIDVGGESTRPNYTQISEEEEITRIAPVIEAIKKNFDIPVSLDTYKYKVAEAGIQAGTDFINDIWGLTYDNGEMAHLIAKYNLPCCFMHNRTNMHYHNFMNDVLNDMKHIISIAQKAGIKKNKIILDVGVGFAKSYENNLEIINHLDIFKNSLGFPVLLGASRKSVIGLTLNLPIEDRLEGTLATTVIGVMKGVAFVRVHDVKENIRAVKMTQAIMKGYLHG
ncbi:MAG: dihydropteroate synthase [Oscillospiraceae bacterium]|nr:dihydropteroate synthase [Oscillospiraceae bacterium]